MTSGKIFLTQGDNGLFAYGYAAATDTYRLLSDAGSYLFNRPEEGRWNNPHVFKDGYWPGYWIGQSWFGLFPSGTASNAYSPENASLAWVVPTGTASYELIGTYYVYPGSLNGVDAYIKRNDTILSPGSQQNFDLASLFFNAGDAIYFSAGAHNDMYFSKYTDWPFLQGQIIVTPTAPVPVPATVPLFGSGLAGLVGARLRRKEK
ncbi:MAG: VPLPA-CTERM sorting domain-containing protein [Proteobacteria bacterium]|nr:VPLPA-CTERM sorting domain-containing protein [Pseudomonadota bacterium]MBU4296201.1 VPLPA-CTERM sorting domain-containing protein [Pseudomonadota bacterium]MCG2748607.1 VPLPA-CTERM sorting domain-containing protein [Desulfobulbaceae bacterium]